MKKFWKRVWVYDLDAQRWNVVFDEALQAWNPFDCAFTGYSWCRQPQPYVFEQWWTWLAATLGSKFACMNLKLQRTDTELIAVFAEKH